MVSQSSPRMIEGRHHPMAKEIRRIVRSGELLSNGMILLETVRLVEDALNDGVGIPEIFISRDAGDRARGLLEQLSPDTELYEVASGVFESFASVQNNQGIVAFAEAPRWREEDLFASQSAIVLVLAGVQDPGNLGAILRSAEAFAASGIILTEGTVSPYNAKVVRAAAGALLRIPLLYNLTFIDTIKLLAHRRVRLLAGVVEGGTRPSAIDFTAPVAVAVGSEGAGLPKELMAASQAFTIPISSKVESLNVAAATAVILYEIARQRNCEGVG